jgi:hypothetical protein
MLGVVSTVPAGFRVASDREYMTIYAFKYSRWVPDMSVKLERCALLVSFQYVSALESYM